MKEETTEGCFLSCPPSEQTVSLYRQRKGVYRNHSQPPMYQTIPALYLSLTVTLRARTPWKMLPYSGLGRNSCRVIWSLLRPVIAESLIRTVSNSAGYGCASGPRTGSCDCCVICSGPLRSGQNGRGWPRIVQLAI